MIFLSIGTGPGMGMATAERFASAGFQILLAARNLEKTRGLADQIKAKGQRAEAFQVDCADPASVKNLVASVLDKYGSVDVLHYNAASMRQANILDQPTESFVGDLAVNIGGALVAAQAVGETMLNRGSGTILLTGGGYALDPNPDFLSLSIGKAGIRALSYGLFDSFRQRGVHVATVTVAANVTPGSDHAKAVAERFWRLHSQSAGSWTVEDRYEG